MPIYIDTIPYNRSVLKTVALPKGQPTGYGNLVFLYSKDIDMSAELINNKTIQNHMKYRFYYYNFHYRGTLYNRRYNIRDPRERKNVYSLMSTRAKVTSHPRKSFKSTKFRNTYFDLMKHIEIFDTMTKKMPPVKRIEAYWKYMGSIFNSPDTKGFENKMVLFNAEYWTEFKGPIKTTLSNPLFMLYYTSYRYPHLLKDIDVDYLIYTGKYVLKINPSQLELKDYVVVKRELLKMFSRIPNSVLISEDELDEDVIDDDIQKETITDAIQSKYNFTGTSPKSEVNDLKAVASEKTSEEEKAIKDKVSKKVSDITNQTTDLIGDKKAIKSSGVAKMIEVQVENDLNNDKDMIDTVYNYVSSRKPAKSAISSKRDEELRRNQKDIKMNNMTLNELKKIDSINIAVPETDIGKSIRTTNPNMKKIRFTNFEKEYNEKLLPKDIANIFTSLNNKSIPMYVRDIQIEDTSDELNYKDTYKILLEDANRQRHTVTVDIPKFLDDKFLYLGGNKKVIIKQNFFYPVVKTGTDEVQIVTNYNKMFITRLSTKSLGPIDRLFKLIQVNDDVKTHFTFGDVSIINLDYLSFIEYDELGKVISSFKTDDTWIYFNRKEATEVIRKNNIREPRGHIYIGENKGKPIFMDIDTQLSTEKKHIHEYIIEAMSDDIQKQYGKIKAGKRLMYNRVKLMDQYIPLITILCYWEGLSSILKKGKIKYRFAKKGVNANIKLNEAYLKFSDCLFIYEDKIANSLLLNGLNILDCSKIKFKDMDTAEPFVEFFTKVYGKTNIINALTNFYEFILDNITLEILESTNLPTDLVTLLLYANTLLSDNAYTRENVQRISRIRSNEIVPAILNKVVADHYIHFRNSGGRKKLSVPRDAVIKHLVALQTVEDYSTLNPISEIEKFMTVSAKGFRGANSERSYTISKRSYDPTMIGVMAMSTSPDGNVGINRSLTMEPNVTNVRGFVDIKNDRKEELKDVNLFSPAELLTTMGATHDDSIRTAHATKQSKHIIPVAKSSPVLITNGADQAIRFNLSKDFVVNAKMDGEVVEIDESTNIIVVKYRNGEHQAVDLSPQVVKNGGGGFYLSNKLNSNLKVGSKFKKNDVIAYHKDFFTNTKLSGATLNMGTLQKIAIMSSYNTYQDSCFITNKLSKDAAADIVYQESGVIGKNANIDFIKNIGDKVEVGDTLVQFDTSYDESELNKFLSSLGDDLKKEINENTKNSLKTKHSGVIEDIKIYSSIDLDEMSPSLKRIVKKYYERISNKKKLLEKYDKEGSIVKCGLLLNETTSKIEAKYGKIKGRDVGEGIIIEFYIKHTDVMGVGDKLAYFTALKSIIGEIIPEGYEPYSEFRPDEEVSTTLAPGSILRRMTPSVILSMFGNKCLVELKRSLFDIYNQ